MVRVLALILPGALGTSLFAQSPTHNGDFGKRQFVARCAGCHGEDGRGGGHGPGIIDKQHPRANSVESVRSVILDGIPGAGMPSFSLPEEEARAIAGYVMSLKQPAAIETIAKAPGDPEAGKRFYEGKGNCASCHMILGLGGVLGPDLSHIGRDRTPAQIEQSLVDPGGQAAATGRGGGRGNRRTPAYPAVTVRLKNGRSIHGIAKNESAFDLQVLGTDNELHLLSKDDVAGISRQKSLMPSVQATPEELRNLIAYLSRLNSDVFAPIAGSAIGPAVSGIPFSSVAEPKTGSWPTYNGNESGNRFSPLDQINVTNVERLAPQWLFTIEGAPRALELTPVVVDGVMWDPLESTCRHASLSIL